MKKWRNTWLYFQCRKPICWTPLYKPLKQYKDDPYRKHNISEFLYSVMLDRGERKKERLYWKKYKKQTQRKLRIVNAFNHRKKLGIFKASLIICFAPKYGQCWFKTYLGDQFLYDWHWEKVNNKWRRIKKFIDPVHSKGKFTKEE